MLIRPAIAATFVLASVTGAQAQPRVVASILPLQSLAAGVMAGIGEPHVVVRRAGSPHSHALRPSEARLLAEADLVFWVGPTYESFLTKPLTAIGTKARAVALLTAPGIRSLPAREGGAWEGSHDHGHGQRPHGSSDEVDPHIFLSPANARAIVRTMADVLGDADPARRAQYEANAALTVARLAALDAELLARLIAVKAVPYVVFHDGYQYFEEHFGLNAVGSITVSPERAPGARRVAAMRRKVTSLGAACVFAEPQFSSVVVRTVVEGTKARTAALDYIGSDLAPGPDAYFAMMRALAGALAGCLAG